MRQESPESNGLLQAVNAVTLLSSNAKIVPSATLKNEIYRENGAGKNVFRSGII